jgi:RNA polymerase sigma-70 factor (ECF subfamily)
VRTLREHFLAQLRVSLPNESAADLDAVLSALWEAGRAAWPTVSVPAAEFTAHLATSLSAWGPVDLLRWPTQVRAADLYLACACASGVPEALRAFEEHILSALPQALGRLRPTPALLDEVTQLVRHHLLLPRAEAGGAPRPPRIHEYRGRGDLRSWVMKSARHLALNLIQRQERPERRASEAVLSVLSSEFNLEKAVAVAEHRDTVKAALEEAFLSLSSRQRNLLRLRLLHGSTQAEIAAMYGVNHATVSRWLQAAQDTALQRVRELLATRLQATPAECDSLIAAMGSQLDLSLSRILRTSQTERPTGAAPRQRR